MGDTTPVLALRGSIVDEETGLKVEGFRVTVKNLSTGRTVAAVTATDEVGYRPTVVDIETGRKRSLLLPPIRRGLFCHTEDGNSQIVSNDPMMVGMPIFIDSQPSLRRCSQCLT